MQLRWRKLWLVIGYILVAVVVIGSLTPPGKQSVIWEYDKIVHGFSYAVLMGWFLQLYRRGLAHFYLAIAFVCLGIGLEVAQSFHPLRHFDYYDMLANTFGVLLAWVLGCTPFGRLIQRFEIRFAP